MKAKAVLLTFALCFAATTVVMAETNPHMGTWKLNEAKSKIAAGAPKNHTVVYESAGDDTKVTAPMATAMLHITSGPASLTGNAIRSPALRLQTSGATR
jgi:hypothetical protein